MANNPLWKDYLMDPPLQARFRTFKEALRALPREHRAVNALHDVSITPRPSRPVLSPSATTPQHPSTISRDQLRAHQASLVPTVSGVEIPTVAGVEIRHGVCRCSLRVVVSYTVTIECMLRILPMLPGTSGAREAVRADVPPDWPRRCHGWGKPELSILKTIPIPAQAAPRPRHKCSPSKRGAYFKFHGFFLASCSRWAARR